MNNPIVKQEQDDPIVKRKRFLVRLHYVCGALQGALTLVYAIILFHRFATLGQVWWGAVGVNLFFAWQTGFLCWRGATLSREIAETKTKAIAAQDVG